MLKEVINLTRLNYLEEKKNNEIIAVLLNGLQNKLELPLEYTLYEKKLTIGYKSKTFKIKNRYSKGLRRFCDFIRPDIERSLSNYGLKSEYEPFLCDMLLSQIDGGLFDLHLITLQDIWSTKNHLNVIETKQKRHVLIQTVYAADQSPVLAGTEILEIENIPMKVFTGSMLDRLIYERNDTIVKIRTALRGDTSVVFYKNDLNISPIDFTSKLFGDTTLYIRIQTFQEGVTDSVKALCQKDTSKIKHIIFDLRESSGGFLYEAFRLVDLFVEKGKFLGRIKKRNSESKYYSENAPLLARKSITMVTDSYTGGAAEILVYSLRKFCNAKVIGQKTMGVCHIRKPFDVGEGRYKMNLPVASIIMAGKYKLNREPIVPDILLTNHLSVPKILGYTVQH